MTKNHKDLSLPLHHQGPIDDPDVQLRVGGGAKSSAWGCFKSFARAIAFATLSVGLFYASLAIWTHASVGRSPSVMLANTASHTSHRHYPLDLSRDSRVNVIAARTTVIVSRAEQAGITLDTTWLKEESSVTFTSDDHQSSLVVQGGPSTSHTVHIAVPSDASHFPRLIIYATRLDFELSPTASDLTFGCLIIDSDESITSPSFIQVEDDLEMTTLHGDIRGNFTFARRLALRTRTGRIDAGLHILDPGSSTFAPPPTVDARADAGSVRLDVLSHAEGVESIIMGQTEMGQVKITQLPDFERAFEADVDLGKLDVSTKAPKRLHMVEHTDTHVTGSVESESGRHSMPPRLDCPPRCEPDQLPANELLDSAPIADIETERGLPPSRTVKGLAKGGLVKASAHFGSVELRL